ncbi:MAG TPA: alpha/beta fold hydrolase [Lacipirellulaceae bacterium]|jgi:haloalkane dehalogenase|nr:alpha/beta fold hydrolase [Lacipirellulaceae bacterium]
MHYIDERPVSSLADDRGACLFVHGNPTWSFHWREFISALSDQYRCVAVDHIGCGLSEKPAHFFTLQNRIDDLCALVEKLDLKRVTLVAQDWGGAIGLGAMLRLRQRLNRIVLFNTAAFPPRYIPWRIRVCRGPIVGRLTVQGANSFSLAALRMTLAKQPKLDPAVAAGYLAPYDSWQHRRAVYGFVRDIPTGPHDSTWQTLADIERQLPELAAVPACLIWGMLDWCFRPDCLDRFLAAWPNAEAHRLTDVGHWVVEDAPDEVLALVKTFLNRTSMDVTSFTHAPAHTNR